MILVTGAAGFIGYHVTERLLAEGAAVLGVDNLNDYYDVRLKHARLEALRSHADFSFNQLDVADFDALMQACQTAGVKTIIHLAAQAGVRYSIENPFAYERSNLAGHLSILEAARSYLASI